MSKTILTKPEIFELKNTLTKVFFDITSIKNDTEIAKYMQYPKIPSFLSESICIHLIQKKIILNELSNYSIDFGESLCDILAQKNMDVKKIEVKSTGHSAFQNIGPKDIVSDYLVWIHFDNSFINDIFDDIAIFTLKQPGKFIKKPQKLTLSKLRDLTHDNLIEERFALDIL